MMAPEAEPEREEWWGKMVSEARDTGLGSHVLFL